MPICTLKLLLVTIIIPAVYAEPEVISPLWDYAVKAEEVDIHSHANLCKNEF